MDWSQVTVNIYYAKFYGIPLNAQQPLTSHCQSSIWSYIEYYEKPMDRSYDTLSIIIIPNIIEYTQKTQSQVTSNLYYTQLQSTMRTHAPVTWHIVNLYYIQLYRVLWETNWPVTSHWLFCLNSVAEYTENQTDQSQVTLSIFIL